MSTDNSWRSEQSAQGRYNVVSFRLDDDELEIAITKAGGRKRVGAYIRKQLFTVPRRDKQ